MLAVCSEAWEPDKGGENLIAYDRVQLFGSILLRRIAFMADYQAVTIHFEGRKQ